LGKQVFGYVSSCPLLLITALVNYSHYESMESWAEVWDQIHAASQLADVTPGRALNDIAVEAARGANIMDESFSTLRRELLRHEVDSEKYRAPLTPRLNELHHV